MKWVFLSLASIAAGGAPVSWMAWHEGKIDIWLPVGLSIIPLAIIIFLLSEIKLEK